MDRDKRRQTLISAQKRLAGNENTYADYFIVNSDFSYQRTPTLELPHPSLSKSWVGVDCKAFAPVECSFSGDRVIILTVARLVKFKGISHSIEAVRRLKTRASTSLRYLIVGDGPERDI